MVRYPKEKYAMIDIKKTSKLTYEKLSDRYFQKYDINVKIGEIHSRAKLLGMVMAGGMCEKDAEDIITDSDSKVFMRGLIIGMTEKDNLILSYKPMRKKEEGEFLEEIKELLDSKEVKEILDNDNEKKNYIG